MTQAARWGFGLMQSTLPDVATIAQHIDTYRSHMKEAVGPYDRNPAFGEVDVARLVYVAPTDAQAKEESAEAVVRHVRSFITGGTGRYFGEVTSDRDDNALSYDHLARNTLLHGSPETVIRKIEALRDVGATSIMLHYPPYYGAEKTSAMLRLFAKEVLPMCRRSTRHAWRRNRLQSRPAIARRVPSWGRRNGIASPPAPEDAYFTGIMTCSYELPPHMI